MLPSDINLNIKSGTVGYNDKIIISNGNFSLGENDKVNTFELAKISHKGPVTLQRMGPAFEHFSHTLTYTDIC